MAINDSGFVTGNSQTADSYLKAAHAFIYPPSSSTTRSTKKMRDLGPLGGKALEGDQSFALGVNIADEVVGYRYLPGAQVCSLLTAGGIGVTGWARSSNVSPSPAKGGIEVS